jgi:Rha family phage regulatory protein
LCNRAKIFNCSSKQKGRIGEVGPPCGGPLHILPASWRGLIRASGAQRCKCTWEIKVTEQDLNVENVEEINRDNPEQEGENSPEAITITDECPVDFAALNFEVSEYTDSTGRSLPTEAITPTLAVVNDTPTVSSLDIAEHFGKRHDHVVRDIRQIISECQEDFNAPNFGAVEYLDEKGEKRPAYSLTRDGFSLLAMGFTGKKALEWKIKYIEAFNSMEKALIRRLKSARTRAENKLEGFKNDSERLQQLRANLKKYMEEQDFWNIPDPENDEKESWKVILHGVLSYWAYIENMSVETARNLMNEFARLNAVGEYDQYPNYNFILKMIHKPIKEGNERVTQRQCDIIRALAEGRDRWKGIIFKSSLGSFLSLYGNNEKDLSELSTEGADRYIHL